MCSRISRIHEAIFFHLSNTVAKIFFADKSPIDLRFSSRDEI